MSFAAATKSETGQTGNVVLQYPQRMDELCSASRARSVSRQSGGLQYPQRMDELCSIIDYLQLVRARIDLQYPQRMDELCSRACAVFGHTFALPCSILSGWMSFAAAEAYEATNMVSTLAVSSADG